MKIRIAPTLVLFLCLLARDGGGILAATLVAALFHEGGHLLASLAAKIPLRSIEFDLMGAKIEPVGLIPSYKKELVLAASGPLFSLLLGLFLLPFGGVFIRELTLATLSLALFNLLPIGDLDGGRVLRATLSPLLPHRLCEQVLAVCSYLFLFLLFSLGACMLLRYGQNLALTVLCASLFAKLFLTS